MTATTHTEIDYEQRKKRNAILGETFYKDENADDDTNQNKELTNKEKFTKTTKGLTSDILIGVIGGGLAGALLGKYSFFAGLGIAGYGHYSDNKMLGTFGLGMMASSSAVALLGGKAQDPKATAMENATERVKGFTNELKRKVWINKWGSTDGLNGGFNNDKNDGSTNAVNQKNNGNDFSKPVEPINVNKFEKLTKDEETTLDMQMQNAGVLAFNQFFTQRHNLNGVNNVTSNNTSVSDIENEMNKATDGIPNKANSKTNTSAKKETDFMDEDDLSGNIEDYMSDDLKKSFYENESKSNSKSNYSFAGTKNKSWEDDIDFSDKLY